jgi:hypothetical protein
MCGVLDGFRGRTLPNEEPPTSSSSRRRDPSRASRGDLRFECGLGGEATTPATRRRAPRRTYARGWIAIDSNDGVWNPFANRYRPALYIADATSVRSIAREAGPTTRSCRTRCRRTNPRPHPPERTSCYAHTERMSGSGMAPASRAAAGTMTPRRASRVPATPASTTCSYPYELPSPTQERLRYPRAVLPRIMARRSICEGPRRSPALPEAPAASARS